MAEAPRWAPRLTGPLALVGLGLSGYLTWEHYSTGATLSCPDTGIVNCLKVTTSAQSVIADIPVALLGVIFFALMAALCVPPAWRSHRRIVGWSRLGIAATGMLMVLYLVAVELIVVRAICLWCTAVHVVTFALFVAVLAALVEDRSPVARPLELVETVGPRHEHDPVP